MTTLDTTRSAPAQLSLGGMIANLFGQLRAWNDARVTRSLLGKLSARELDDIGLSRGDIELVATMGRRY